MATAFFFWRTHTQYTFFPTTILRQKTGHEIHDTYHRHTEGSSTGGRRIEHSLVHTKQFSNKINQPCHLRQLLASKLRCHRKVVLLAKATTTTTMTMTTRVTNTNSAMHLPCRQRLQSPLPLNNTRQHPLHHHLPSGILCIHNR